MPARAYVQALEELERDAVGHRVCMVLSESTHMQREVARLYVDGVVTEQPDFNLARLTCTRDTAAAAVEALGEELPIMAERRLVWLRDVHLLADPQALKLAAYLGEASSSTWFLLTSGPPPPQTAETEGAETPRGSGLKKLTEAVKKLGLVVEGTMTEEQVLDWMRRELSRLGVEADGEARRALTERVGHNLTALSTEIEKLACYVGERRRIEAGDVGTMVRAAPARKIFDLSDAIADRDGSRALSILGDLLDAEEHPLRLLAYLSTTYRGLLRIKSMRLAGMSSGRIAAAIGKKEGYVKRVERIVDRLSEADLEGAVEAMVRADQGMKSGKDEVLLLQMLVIFLCRVGARSR